MHFLVIFKNKDKGTLNEPLLLEHVSYLKRIQASKHLVICGPFADDTNAVQVIEAESKLEAEQIVKSDPFIEKSYYRDYSITEFYSASNANNWLIQHEQTTSNLGVK